MTTAFVSGATGFIAQHVIKLLLAEKYKVIGSVRSQAKGDHLVEIVNSPLFTYVVIPDIAAPGSFDEALKSYPNINVFYHIATPAFFPEDNFEELLIKPAVAGTINALEATHKYGKNITNFVYTSSYVAAVNSDVSVTVSEDSWNEITLEEAVTQHRKAYAASKTYAEHTGWKYVKEHQPHFKFTSLLPTFASGPQAYDSSAKEPLNVSAELLNNFLKYKPSDPIPAHKFYYFDVRDVARAHLLAYENPAIAGERLLLANGGVSGQLIANIIRDHFPELRDTVPEGDPSKVEESLKRDEQLDNSKTLQLLGFEPFNFEQSVVDAISQILNAKK